MSRSPVVGLDVGTTKICTVVAEVTEPGDAQILGVGVSRSLGLKKGIVVDVEDTVRSIRASVAEAERMAGTEVRSVIAGITGSHVSSMNTRGAVAVAGDDNGISGSDVQRVMEAASVVVIPPDRQVIHAVPRGFTVDGQDGVRRPIGMFGSRLEVEMHLVTGLRAFIDNVAQCVEGAGLDLERLVMEAIATGEAVATPAELELGVAIVDIGGGTTDVALFGEGSIGYSAAIPIAGNHVTYDLAVGVRTPTEEAERIKLTQATVAIDTVGNEEHVEIRAPGSAERRLVPRRLVAEIVLSRQRELLELVKSELTASGLVDRLASGVVLTGGGALLHGTRKLAEQVLELPVRIGLPLDVRGMSSSVNSPIFATGVGLVRFGVRHPETRSQTPAPVAFAQSAWDRLRALFRMG
ncbi:MAG: cell division protein FtsA [Armatimonadetes bacterium CG17_big_fil_post_rev_8_21_14_2_50_66_6]|nr:MAG: cell division protein FtsA [Armatimonadetes bacterium CG17_big_fil_post_rev_8_21_14_2_50_66_6]